MSEIIDAAEQLNQMLGGFEKMLGVRYLKATLDEVVAEAPVGPHLHQPYGIVHGGVYAALIETVTSVGAALVGLSRDQSAVGLENHTSFLRAVREGTLIVRAVPLTRGRRSQVWEATVSDQNGKVAASGRVRLLCLDEGASVAGETVELKNREE